MSKIEEKKKETNLKARKKRRHIAPQVKKKWLGNLLEDEKVAALLLRFLKTIGIRRREGEGRGS